MSEEKAKLLVAATRREVLKASIVLLPYVAPAILSFTATPANAKDVSPGGDGHGGGGGGNDDDGHDDNGHGNDPGHNDPSNPGNGRGGHGVDPG